MANRRPHQNSGRRIDYRNDRGPKNFGRAGVSPWQGGGPGAGLNTLLPLAGGSTEATLALANNLISNLLQSRQQAVPSLLDMPIRRDFGPDMGRFDRGGYGGPQRMGNQGNFRRSGNYNRAGDRMNNRKFKPGDGQRHQNKTTPKKDADSKSKPVKESATEVKSEGDEATVKTEEGTEEGQTDAQKKESPKTRYDELNPSLLKCHICNKSMWDGRSFENHLSGRAHAIMMQKTAESYALTADTMRQEFKIREMKRTRKTGQQTPRDFYCAMCDMYAADGAAHRTTIGHRKLKKYLHPACTSCHKEMPTRIELDEHRLTIEHLKNVHEKQEVTSKPKPEVMVISTLAMEQSYVRDDRQRRKRHTETDDDDAKKEEEKEGEDGEQTEGVVKKEPVEGAPEAQDGGPEAQDGATEEGKLLLDFKEDDDIVVTPDMIPSYSTTRPVGRSFLSPLTCYQCSLCRKLLDSQETAAVHLLTWRHHQLYARKLMHKANGGDNKRTSSTSQAGGGKRRKTSDEGAENGLEDGDVEMKEEDPRPDADMSAADGDAEPEWERAVDEILHDEAEAQGETQEAAVEEAPEQKEETVEEEPVKETPPSPVATPAKPETKPKTPRGRGRGRRGRY
ncbi:hypothetical protein JYU34_019541 [Plutella xylostella]|uniref:C2H2-type domain-containing protein n=1 Tax=Plutella xylostella TaxID=51655 RepID=A0ABQ7PXR4_PLUXY|nr:hypothetical protein JYU34_019541 [Plutella xylostella]